MELYITDTTEPALNLAIEECLLRGRTGDIFFLWRNVPSIIIGRNQNAYSEINEEYVKDNNIPVVRRMTGGGAVFHDLGNINFTFICDCADGDDDSFERFTAPVIDYLRSLGVNAAFSGRNDIAVDGMKISGNAQTRVGNRFLHHGTLLFGAAMTDLAAALRPHPLKVRSKGIKSVAARVTNISEHLPRAMDVTEFMAGLLAFVESRTESAKRCELTPADMAAAEKLAAERYRRWDWNFGENPGYAFDKTAKFPGGLIEVQMNIAEEVIDTIHITGDFFAYGDISVLENALCGISHRRDAVEAAIRDLPLQKYIGSITAQQLTDTMF